MAHVLDTHRWTVDVLRRDGVPLVNEFSYYYEGWLVAACPGHWTMRDGSPTSLSFVDGPMAPEDAILTDFLDEVAAAAQQPRSGRGGR